MTPARPTKGSAVALVVNVSCAESSERCTDVVKIGKEPFALTILDSRPGDYYHIGKW